MFFGPSRPALYVVPHPTSPTSSARERAGGVWRTHLQIADSTWFAASATRTLLRQRLRTPPLPGDEGVGAGVLYRVQRQEGERVLGKCAGRGGLRRGPGRSAASKLFVNARDGVTPALRAIWVTEQIEAPDGDCE